MHYIKKLCILKQLSSGFAADGRKVSALLTAESIPGRLTLSLAAIGFAPLSAGRYRCLVCDAKGQTELFDMSESGGSVKKDSALDISEGLACLVCFAGGRVTPVAFGKCGDRVYDVKKLCALVDGTENPAKDAGGKTEETSAGKRGSKNLPAPAAQGAEGAEHANDQKCEAICQIPLLHGFLRLRAEISDQPPDAGNGCQNAECHDDPRGEAHGVDEQKDADDDLGNAQEDTGYSLLWFTHNEYSLQTEWIYFLTNSTPSVLGPQWQETVQPAWDSHTSSKSPYRITASLAAATASSVAAGCVMKTVSRRMSSRPSSLFFT